MYKIGPLKDADTVNKSQISPQCRYLWHITGFLRLQKPALSPTDMENTPPEKITDIGHIHNPNLYFEYSAYKNCRYHIYSQPCPNLLYSQLITSRVIFGF